MRDSDTEHHRLDKYVAVDYIPCMKAGDLMRIRQELGLTQRGLADELGVHRVTIAKWEAGDRRISEPIARLVQRIRAELRRRKRK